MLYTENGCLSCPSNATNSVNGLCIPGNATIVNPQFFQFTNQTMQSIVSSDIAPVVLGSYTNQITSFTFSFQYRRISYPESDVIGIMSLYQLSANGQISSLLEFYEYQNSIYFISKFNNSTNVFGSISNIYSQNANFEWLNVVLACDLNSGSCILSVYNYKSGTLTPKAISSNITSTSATFQLPSNNQFAIGFDLSGLHINNSGILGSPGTNTAFELSNVIFVPNYMYQSNEIQQYRPPVPSSCNRNCLCACVNNACPTNCLLKNSIIELLHNGIANAKNFQASSSCGLPHLLFKGIKSRIMDHSYNIPTDQLQMSSLDFSRFVVNAEINLNTYFLSSVNATQTLSVAKRQTTDSASSTPPPTPPPFLTTLATNPNSAFNPNTLSAITTVPPPLVTTTTNPNTGSTTAPVVSTSSSQPVTSSSSASTGSTTAPVVSTSSSQPVTSSSSASTGSTTAPVVSTSSSQPVTNSSSASTGSTTAPVVSTSSSQPVTNSSSASTGSTTAPVVSTSSSQPVTSSSSASTGSTTAPVVSTSSSQPVTSSSSASTGSTTAPVVSTSSSQPVINSSSASTGSTTTPVVSTSSSSSSSITSSSTNTSSNTSTCPTYSNLNPDILYIISNKFVQTSALRQGQSIPESVILNSIVTVRITSHSTLRIIIGSSPIAKYVSYKDINLIKPLSSLTKLNIITYCDFNINTAKIIIFADDARFDVTFNYNFSSEPINRSTAVYSNPSLSSMNLIVSPARVDYALTYLLKDKTPYSDFCDPNCTQCFDDLLTTTCLACNNIYGLYNGICRAKSFTASPPVTTSKRNMARRSLNNVRR